MYADPARIKIGISACLVGQEVRYDGSHKRDAYITNTLGQYFDFVALCPEVAVGLGIPRPTIHLVRKAGDGVGTDPDPRQRRVAHHAPGGGRIGRISTAPAVTQGVRAAHSSAASRSGTSRMT